MGNINNKITRTYIETGETRSYTASVDANGFQKFDEQVPPGGPTHYDWNVKRSEMVMAMLESDIGCTITDGASPPVMTPIVLLAGVVYEWDLVRDTLTAGPGKVLCPYSVDLAAGINVTPTVSGSPPVAARLRMKVLRTV